jgi:hypothetical protein
MANKLIRIYGRGHLHVTQFAVAVKKLPAQNAGGLYENRSEHAVRFL